jgi:ATP-dependent helicase/DNAse subunit B
MTKDPFYSVTNLEAYLKCPFRYYAGSVLKLTPVIDCTDDEALKAYAGTAVQ